MDLKPIERLIRRPLRLLSTRRATLEAGAGAVLAAAGLAGADEPAKAGKKKARCLKVNKRCGGGKKCCSKRCCSGWCADKGATCCSAKYNGLTGWCDAEYPVCCDPDIREDRCCTTDFPECCPKSAGNFCCPTGYPNCCAPTSWEPDGYCCHNGYRCVDSRDRCELDRGDSVSDGTPIWKSSGSGARQVNG